MINSKGAHQHDLNQRSNLTLQSVEDGAENKVTRERLPACNTRSQTPHNIKSPCYASKMCALNKLIMPPSLLPKTLQPTRECEASSQGSPETLAKHRKDQEVDKITEMMIPFSIFQQHQGGRTRSRSRWSSNTVRKRTTQRKKYSREAIQQGGFPRFTTANPSSLHVSHRSAIFARCYAHNNEVPKEWKISHGL